MRRRRPYLLVAVMLLGCLGCSPSVPLPPKAAELNQSGVLALERGDLETADSRFSLALEYSPRFVEALTNLGLLELQRGNFEQSRKLLTKARSINPDIAQPHHGLGLLAEREGQEKRARDHYRDALRIDPGFVPARSNLARLLFAGGELEQARIEYSKLIEADPGEPLGYAGLSESLLRLDRTGESDAIVEKAHARFPESGEVELLWCRRLLRRGQTEEATRHLLPLTAKRDDLAVSALGWLATARLAQGRPELALGAARRALSLKANDSVALYAFAISLSSLRDPSAVGWLKRALELAPGNQQLQSALERSSSAEHGQPVLE